MVVLSIRFLTKHGGAKMCVFFHILQLLELEYCSRLARQRWHCDTTDACRRVALIICGQDNVAADIRACVAYARSEYKPTSVGLMGFCYGGGKALEEAAAGNAFDVPHEMCVNFILCGVNVLTVC